MPSRKITTVLFDLDGTLLDTAPDLAKALNVVLQNHKREQIPFEKIRPISSAGTRGLLELGFQIDENHPKYNLLREQFLNAYHEHLKDETVLFPGMETVIKHLNKKDISWGVVTNKPTHLATQLLEHFSLAHQCECIIGGDTLAKRKPDPEPLLYACEIIGCSTDQCVYIGDASRDIEAAKRANMLAIAALYGYIANDDKPKSWNADHYINNPEEIIRWLGK